jgi:D-glycero-D-manno-heptose 1,7-bisphosphate phosphatase
VTNQSGIGRGYYSEEDFKLLTSWMLDEFKKENIHIISVDHCNHAPEENCACRKTQIGMVNEILSQNSIDLENSWLIGDKQSDIDLATNAKIGNSIAIGKRKMVNFTLSFESISECKDKIKIL